MFVLGLTPVLRDLGLQIAQNFYFSSFSKPDNIVELPI